MHADEYDVFLEAVPSIEPPRWTPMNGETHTSGPVEYHAPQFVLDAGGEHRAALRSSMYRSIATLQDGQLLEVISRYPGSRTEIPDWCRNAGHLLVAMVERGDETLFWISKRATRTGSGARAGALAPNHCVRTD